MKKYTVGGYKKWREVDKRKENRIRYSPPAAPGTRIKFRSGISPHRKYDPKNIRFRRCSRRYIECLRANIATEGLLAPSPPTDLGTPAPATAGPEDAHRTSSGSRTHRAGRIAEHAQIGLTAHRRFVYI
ncbi:hypothetical protein EVAR_49362_1 [Eumeta japonica]|uniref:Uncharacterized protein n=1 Tax=Eumeta variegata TaxID=151549 RepID=A0A4C1XV86_EUMVA|nr:hypothetical protein EVAR_49362_1 [Eumeta japonica]